MIISIRGSCTPLSTVVVYIMLFNVVVLFLMCLCIILQDVAEKTLI